MHNFQRNLTLSLFPPTLFSLINILSLAWLIMVGGVGYLEDMDESWEEDP